MKQRLHGTTASHSLLSLFSITTQDHLPRDGTSHSGMASLASICKPENTTQTCLWANLVEEFSQSRFVFPEYWLVFHGCDKAP